MAQTLLLLCIWCLAISATVALLYGWDKWRAARGRWRVAESALHLGALLGGWPGAMLAGHLLRHKTRKRSFRMVRALCIALNVIAVATLLGLLYQNTL